MHVETMASISVASDPINTAAVESALPDIDEENKENLRRLITNNYNNFAFKTSELGHTTLVKHVIDTQGQGPTRQKAYRTSQKQKEIAKNIIEELIQIKYRPLFFPLPRIDDVLDLLVGQRYFSTLDLTSGYWQIEFEEESKEKTACIVDYNLYEMNRLAFGLTNAPGTFQRLMNSVLRKVIGMICLVYLDDIIIFSRTIEEHFINLKTVFSLLEIAHLKMKLSKCEFFSQSVSYLGHTKGKPTDSVTWKTDETVAFEYLRQCLISESILIYLDFLKEFFICTDASNYGLGAVLSQMKDGKDQPIAYASRHLNKGEIEYSTIEKEAAAVVFGIKRFRHYLQDQPSVIVSDHRPLQWLQTFKDETGRLGRWAILLSNMKFNVQYRTGRVHENADFLSRILINLISAIPADNNVMCQEQEKDSLCKAIVTFLEQNEPWKKEDGPMPSWDSEIDHFFVENGLLCKHYEPTSVKRRNIKQCQVVVPLSLRKQLLKEYHDSPLSGHMATRRTFFCLRDKYYWPTMLRDVKEYCTSCEPCALGRRVHSMKAYFNPLDLATRPFEVLGLDFLGPIKPHSLQGNNYILVITDYFSKWIEVIPLTNCTALSTSKALVERIILHHGTPKAIITDRGSSFISELYSALGKALNNKRMKTTAYHPQTNGLSTGDSTKLLLK
ncbi:Uncharacterized protein APZ42_016190 [Daphnia magna]|uniref:RNA-directed DNA polymerase n=1 Tax=Daphnia magna TaxID=35525 RepID=A0A165AJE7_9CRUS|nr:Uncharacterized protein APZ42_016190 [Daphnia magna]